MEGIFLEWENENALRSYPFAAGCVPSEDFGEIPAGVFVDAMLYPVNPSGELFLSGVADGTISISDASGVIMTGTQSGKLVEMYDTTGLRRHVGTLVASSGDALSDFLGVSEAREYSLENTAFAASCIMPVVIDGVSSVSVADSGMASRTVEFSNSSSDDVRVSSSTRQDGRKTLRFDIIPRQKPKKASSIKRVICVVDGKTPFRIQKSNMAGNSVILTLDNIDKGVVCAAAHRESEYEMTDTCECDKRRTPSETPIPEAYQLEEVYIPPIGGQSADNAFYLIVPNLLGYDNPLSITLEDGVAAPKTGDPEVVLEGDGAVLAEGALQDEITSKGVVLQVPGLSGGRL